MRQLTAKTWHRDAVGTLDREDYSVSRDDGDESRKDSEEMHLEIVGEIKIIGK
jgi:hypothetical protein